MHGKPKLEGDEFNEACRELAAYAGIEIPKPKKTKEALLNEEKRIVRGRIAAIVECWHTRLTDDLRQFLNQQYGLQPETISYCRVGYAKGDVDALLSETGLSVEEARSTGLVIKGRDSKPFIPLTGRLTFTWLSGGMPCYVAGRAIESTTYKPETKWINQSLPSKERPAIATTVEKPLWGADSLRGASRVLIPEGIPDAYAAWQAREFLGEDWAIVSSCSTQMKESYRKQILSAIGDGEAVIAFDADGAGREAAIALGSQLALGGAAVRIVDLPGREQDLCDYLRDNGPEAIVDIIEDAEDLIVPWLLRLRRDPDTLDAELEKSVYPVIGAMASTRKAKAIDYLSSMLSIPKTQLSQDISKVLDGASLGKVSRAVDIIDEHYRAIGYEQTEQSTALVLWARKRKNLVRLPLTSLNKIPGMMAPVVDVVGELRSIKGVGKNEASSLLRDGLFYLTKKAPPMSNYRMVKSGLHIVEGRIIIVSGERMLVKEPGRPWVEATDPFITEHCVVDCSDEDDWLEFNIDELNRPIHSNYAPDKVYELLCEAIKRGWELKHKGDVNILALLPFAFTWDTVFPRKPLVHFQGKSGSGKSTLVKGFYGGAANYARMGGPFIVTGKCEDNITEAGLNSRYSESAHTLLLDEGEINVINPSKKDRNTLDALISMRNAAESGAGRLRGTAEGGWRRTVLNMGCICSSVNSWEADQEIRRWLVIQPEYDDEWDSPGETIAKFWAQQGADCREMRRSILLAFQNNYEDLRAAYEELLYGHLPYDGLMSPSHRDNVLPILATAKMLDENFESVAERLFRSKAEYEVESRTLTLEERIVSDLISSPFEIDRVPYTVYQLATSGSSSFRRMSLGGVVVADGVVENKVKRMLWVATSIAQKTGPLRGTEFERLSPRKLLNILRNHHAFIDYGTKRQFEGIVARWARLDWEKIVTALDLETEETVDEGGDFAETGEESAQQVFDE